MFKMLLHYFLLVSLCQTQVWSYLILPSQLGQLITPTPNANNGEPLILTPYLKSNQTPKARSLSNVEPFIKGIVSNSGFFTVDEKYNSNLFFWFFRKAGTDWQKAPLLLWLQGGPGCSSLYGLFEENGPFMVTKKGHKRRKFSWTNHYNVIYIDQPVGTGFSFTNSSQGYIHNQTQVADHLYEALTQFFQLYPELKDNEFYVTGESYGGRYVPAIAYKIHILKMAAKCSINLKGLFLVSASTDGLTLIKGLADLSYHIGVIDFRTKLDVEIMERDIESSIHSRLWGNASRIRSQVYRKILEQSYVNLYDYTKHFERKKEYYIEFLQSSDTQKKIHVGNSSYLFCSHKVYNDFFEDVLTSVKPWVEELLEHYPVAFVGGQYDVIVGYPLVLNLLKKLQWSGAFEYSVARRDKLFDGRLVAGYIKTAGNLKDIMMRGAGHMVPKDQPRATLDLLNKFIDKKI